MTKIDRTGWPSGEWDAEPDRIEWRVGDFYCLVNRTGQGHLCGYVGVQEGHQWYDQDYEAINAEVHGGLTFAGRWKKEDSQVPPHLYLLGFDCAHSGDRSPAMYRSMLGLPTRNWETYRNFSYATSYVRQLLYQAGGDRTLEAVRVVDDERVELTFGGVWRGKVTGDGTELLRKWVRFGESRLDIAADWLEDHPEFVVGLTTPQVASVAASLRSLVVV